MLHLFASHARVEYWRRRVTNPAMADRLVVGAGGSAANQVTTFQIDLVGEARGQPGSRRVLGGDPSPARQRIPSAPK